MRYFAFILVMTFAGSASANSGDAIKEAESALFTLDLAKTRRASAQAQQAKSFLRALKTLDRRLSAGELRAAPAFVEGVRNATHALKVSLEKAPQLSNVLTSAKVLMHAIAAEDKGLPAIEAKVHRHQAAANHRFRDVAAAQRDVDALASKSLEVLLTGVLKYASKTDFPYDKGLGHLGTETSVEIRTTKKGKSKVFVTTTDRYQDATGTRTSQSRSDQVHTGRLLESFGRRLLERSGLGIDMKRIHDVTHRLDKTRARRRVLLPSRHH